VKLEKLLYIRGTRQESCRAAKVEDGIRMVKKTWGAVELFLVDLHQG
jgi:hypothetical protein